MMDRCQFLSIVVNKISSVTKSIFLTSHRYKKYVFKTVDRASSAANKVNYYSLYYQYSFTIIEIPQSQEEQF